MSRLLFHRCCPRSIFNGSPAAFLPASEFPDLGFTSGAYDYRARSLAIVCMTIVMVAFLVNSAYWNWIYFTEKAKQTLRETEVSVFLYVIAQLITRCRFAGATRAAEAAGRSVARPMGPTGGASG